MSDAYKVQYSSANAAIGATRTAAAGFSNLASNVSSYLANAGGGLPTEFGAARAKILQFNNANSPVLVTIETWTGGVIEAAQGCLASYENASVEQVIQTQQAQARVSQMSGAGLFGDDVGSKIAPIKKANTFLEAAMPSRDPGNGQERSWGYSRDATTTATSDTRATTTNGLLHSETTSTSVRSETTEQNNRYSSSTTKTLTQSVTDAGPNGESTLTRTRTGFYGYAHDVDTGADEQSVRGFTDGYSQTQDGVVVDERSRTRGAMALPTAP